MNHLFCAGFASGLLKEAAKAPEWFRKMVKTNVFWGGSFGSPGGGVMLPSVGLKPTPMKGPTPKKGKK